MSELENMGPENEGLENIGLENAGLQNEGPYCTWWKMKDQEEATLCRSHQLNTAVCFSMFQ